LQSLSDVALVLISERRCIRIEFASCAFWSEKMAENVDSIIGMHRWHGIV
jgi:predicted CopG family antitoxin